MDIPKTKNWDDQAYRLWIRWNYDRRLEIWDLNNRVTRSAGGDHCIWAGMNSGSLSGQSRNFRDYKEICRRAEIIMLDSQARNDAEGFQQNGGIGKLIHGLLGWEKLIPESMAMYQAGRPAFRLARKPEPEARMWIIEGFAGGIQPWWHHVSAYHEDRRMYHTAGPLFSWHKNNESFLLNRKPLASVGVVWSQQNTDFYGRDNSESLVDLPLRGISQAMLRARIPFVPVHADHIEREADGLSLLILPNFAAATIDHAEAIRRFVGGGGNLLATGQSTLFNEWGDPLPDFALADIFGAHMTRTGKYHKDLVRNTGTSDAVHTYLRLLPELRRQVDGPQTGNEPVISRTRHEILKGFEETDILAFGGQPEPVHVDDGSEVLMTFIPEFPVYPPETAWMREPVTTIPGLITRTGPSGSRIAYMPADIDRQYGRYNLPDHGDLLANIIRWAAADSIPVNIKGPGLVDVHLYAQKERLILHLVNLTNSGTWRQPVDELITVGPFRVMVKLQTGISDRNAQLLVSGIRMKAPVTNGWISLELDRILDHEVIVID
jgi:hypothetical protein